MVAVYGNRAFDDTLLELEDALTQAGFRVVAGVAAVAEHSILRQFGAGRPDAADQAQLLAFGEALAQRLRSDLPVPAPKVPGNRPYRDYQGVPFKPATGAGCNGCGVCVQVCPVGAISGGPSPVTDTGRCISCMRCVAVCPVKARTLNPLLLATAAVGMKKVCSSRKENFLYLS